MIMKTKFILILTVIFSIILCSNAFCMTDKMQSFIEDDRFKDGVSWDNSKKVQYGNWTGYGCAGYATEFVNYCFGGTNPKIGVYFDDSSEITDGDVVYRIGNMGDHWFCVLEKNDDEYYIAEGNYNSKVRVAWVDEDYVTSGFQNGYHWMNINSNNNEKTSSTINYDADEYDDVSEDYEDETIVQSQSKKKTKGRSAVGGATVWNNNTNGISGWQYENNNWYFYNNGIRDVNKWVFYNGYWYYLDGQGKMLTNTITPDGYNVDFEGKWVN